MTTMKEVMGACSVFMMSSTIQVIEHVSATHHEGRPYLAPCICLDHLESRAACPDVRKRGSDAEVHQESKPHSTHTKQ